MFSSHKWNRLYYMADGEGTGNANGGEGGDTGGDKGGTGSAAQILNGQQNTGGNTGGDKTGDQNTGNNTVTKWYGDSPETEALVTQRAWKSPADVIESYRNLEKLASGSGDKLVLPKEESDKDGWNRVYKTLGRPDTADAYQIPIADGGDKEQLKVYQGKAFELGLTQKQAAELAKWHDGLATQGGANEEAAFQQKLTVEVAQVKDNWGQNYNQNAEIARRGSDALGLTGAEIDKAERALGHKKVMDMFLKVGQGSKEGRYIDSDGGGNFNPATKESAQARLDDIKNNPIERGEALKQGSDRFKEVERLSKIIAGARL